MDRFFKLKENNTTVRIEVIAGITTFLTMSYIIFVQPAILSIPMNAQGPPADYFGAVLLATCIASALSCFIMAWLANYPIGLAPGMGENFYFAFTVCGAAAMGGLGYSWQIALTAVFIAGLVFLLLSFFKVRETVMDCIPNGLKLAIAGGIGFLIAFVGLQYAGIIEPAPGSMVKLGKLSSPWVLLSLFGLIVSGTLMAKKVRGAMLIGILLTAVVGLFMRGGVPQEGGSDALVRFQGIWALPPSLAPTFFKFDFAAFLRDPRVWEVVFIFLILDMFDTIGTLIGVGHAAGLMTKDGKLPKAGRAFIADAVGTTIGAACGTSTVTSYIESSTGVAAGGRTGLTAVVVGLLFLLAIFFSPIAKMIGGGYNIAMEGTPVFKYPVIAAPLIIVGSLMMKGLKDVGWDDTAIAISAFITIIMMPLTLSIATGIAFGFISYTVIKLLSGKGREVHWLLYVVSLIFLLRFIFLPV